MRTARKLMVAVAGAVLLAGALELGARVAVARLPRFAELSASDWYAYTADTGWEPRPGYAGKVYGTWREFGPRGIQADDVRELAESPGSARIVLLGDSCTFGHRVPQAATFAELLERELAPADVVNLGVPGYSSYQAWRRLAKVALELHPAVVVFATNYNDRRYVARDEDARFAWDRAQAAVEAPLARLARGSRLVRVLRELAGAEDLEEERAASGLRRSDLHPRVSPERYAEHLEKVAREVAAAGARPVFLLLGDAPDETRELDRGLALLALAEAAGSDAERAEHARAAEGVLRAAEERGGAFALLARSARSNALEILGRGDDARALDVLATFLPSLHGGVPIEHASVYHARMRAVAAAQGALLVDGAAVLEPGDYFDFCHFGPAGHRRLAELLAEALRPLL